MIRKVTIPVVVLVLLALPLMVSAVPYTHFGECIDWCWGNLPDCYDTMCSGLDGEELDACMAECDAGFEVCLAECVNLFPETYGFILPADCTSHGYINVGDCPECADCPVCGGGGCTESECGSMGFISRSECPSEGANITGNVTDIGIFGDDSPFSTWCLELPVEHYWITAFLVLVVTILIAMKMVKKKMRKFWAGVTLVTAIAIIVMALLHPCWLIVVLVLILIVIIVIKYKRRK